MWFDIVSLVLSVVFGLVAFSCLLRLYMQWHRVPFGNPLGRFIIAVSNWLVLPLRRVLRQTGRWDTASLMAALSVELVHYALLMALRGGFAERPESAAYFVVVFAVFGLARLAISGLLGLVIVYAILSWTRADNPVTDVIERICEPPLRPIRRILGVSSFSVQ